MAKRTYPLKGTHAHRLLLAMMTHTMGRHPEFLQEAGQSMMVASIAELQNGNIPVQTRLIPMPAWENPHRQVVECFLSDDVCQAIFEEGQDD